VKSSSVDIVRPRTLDSTFQPDFVELVHDLRDHIGRGKKS
jgi:NitT/TauT family transport system ATP-binding protein